jgi:hypothetical protein
MRIVYGKCWLLVVDTRHVHDVTTLFRRLSRAYFFVYIFLYIRAQRGRQRSSRFFALTLAVLASTVKMDSSDIKLQKGLYEEYKEDAKDQWKIISEQIIDKFCRDQDM